MTLGVCVFVFVWFCLPVLGCIWAQNKSFSLSHSLGFLGLVGSLAFHQTGMCDISCTCKPPLQLHGRTVCAAVAQL